MEYERILGLRRRPRGGYPRRFLNLYQERGYFVLHDLLTGRRRFYARPIDVYTVLIADMTDA
ncbi:MAG: hypothetical protein A2Z34_00515 [Planctomycetes bacterium RBG_16_59_8]|nr:MAG: hypothetical protein A2Z34_00515 [Planctomycetes bacterium RBG_16_59_8]